MSFSIADFEDAIDPTIVGRGYDYWRRGYVDEPEEREDDKWAAYVQGTDAYEVRIALSKGRIASYSCSCPYEFGPICKHVVAVLYKLREQWAERARSESEDVEVAPRPKRRTIAKRVDDALQSISGERAKELLRRLALDNQDVRLALFAADIGRKERATKADFKDLIQGSLRAARGRSGFIDYGREAMATQGSDAVFRQARELRASDRVEEAIDAYLSIIQELTPALNYADDSDGEIGGSIDLAFEELSDCVIALEDPAVRSQTFRLCLDESANDLYEWWDWKWDFLTLCAPLVGSDEEEEALFRALDDRTRSNGDETSGWHREYRSRYAEERAADIKLTALKRRGDNAIDRFTRDNLHLPSMREKAMRAAFEAKQFDEVKRLAEDAIRQADKDGRSGEPLGWIRWLLRVAQAESDTAAIRRHARRLFLEDHDFHNYTRLKETYASADWPTVAEKLLLELDSRFPFMAAQIYIREEMWDRLLEYVRRNLSHNVLRNYGEHLDGRYPEEMAAFYEEIARKTLLHTSDRGTYAQAAELLRRIGSLGFPARAEELIAEFIERYPRRSAMIDELSQV